MAGELRFAVNLRRDTTTDSFVDALHPWGWLAAPENTTRATRAFARAAAARGRQFIADNGNYGRIGRVAAAHRAEGATLRQKVSELEDHLGRSVSRRDLPRSLAARYDRLVTRVMADVAARASTDDELLNAQLALGPTRLVGVEDLTMACLLAVGVEPWFLDWPRSRWRSFNRDVARRAASLADQRGADIGTGWYPVASALDHSSAVDAGREFASAGLRRVSMGFGAYMADDYSEDRVRVGRRTVRFGEQLPLRYLRTVLVARGFRDGYEDVAGRPPDGLHCLGLGAPIMMGLVALATEGVASLSFDAMSPIRDATDGTLYSERRAYLKVRTRSIARRIADDRPWRCPCPFCRAFAQAHPFDEPAAARWGAAHPDKAVQARDLRPRGALYAALPLLSEPRGGSFRRAVNEARAGHNHWVLIRICARLERHASRGDLERHVGEVVAAYEGATNAPRFGRAVRFGYEVAQGVVR